MENVPLICFASSLSLGSQIFADGFDFDTESTLKFLICL